MFLSKRVEKAEALMVKEKGEHQARTRKRTAGERINDKKGENNYEKANK
ncbi:hypothetical protein [Carnobacterium sp.]|nr:hypothetical protein [Carnobacterium sp.]